MLRTTSSLTVSLLQSLAVCSRSNHRGVSGESGAGRPRKRAEDFEISSHVSPALFTVRLTLNETRSKEGASRYETPSNIVTAG